MSSHRRSFAPEKLDFAANHVEEISHTNSQTDDGILGEFSLSEQKKIIRKIDLRLVPICGIMYCISLLDRTNLSAANIAGMSKALKLTINERYVSMSA